MKRYEQLAQDIASSIHQGLLKPGDKLPSVRQASEARSVSPSTIFKAYYLLEAQGLIYAQERSGYFVNNSGTLPALPDTTAQFTGEITEVDVSELVFEVLESCRNLNVIPLGSAFPSPLLFPLDKLARLMSKTVQSMDPYLCVSDIGAGDAELRRLIALRYMIDGLSTASDEIVITNGALEALNLCLQAVTKAGDAVLISSPSFYATLQAIECNSLRAIEIPCSPQTGINLEFMQQAIEQHKPKACWIMTQFQNPTGSLFPTDNKKQLVALLAKYDIPLIEDDVYGELYFTEQRPMPAKSFDQKGLVMHCSSFSKCLAPGYRVGWVAAGRYAKTIERLKLTTSLATSVPTQITLANYLQTGHYDRHLRKLRQTLLLQQMKFIEAIELHFPKGTCLNQPQGGYFIWVKLPDHVNALHLHRQALNAGISIAPGPIFSSQRHYSDYIRLNCGHLWSETIESAIITLGKMVAAYKHPT